MTRPIGKRIKAGHLLFANERRKANSNALEYRLAAASGEKAVTELRDRLIRGLNLRDAVVLVESEHGVETSLGAMSGFHKRVCLPFLAEQTRQAAALASAIDEEYSDDDFDAANRILISQTAFELLSDRSADPKARAAMVKNLIAAQKNEHDIEKFRASLKSKIDAGLDALFEEIQGNDAAEAKFAELREVVANA